MKLTRRQFSGFATSLAFLGLSKHFAYATENRSYFAEGYGPLQEDPDGLLDLPRGFSYRIISELGQTMTDGLVVPDKADGMGCIALDDTRVALVRNHELKVRDGARGPFAGGVDKSIAAYDYFRTGSPLPGGTTTLVYDLLSGKVVEEYLSLVGTIRNCAGGVTPWGSWLTCEEDVTRAGQAVEKDHGWVFEVPASAKGPIEPTPLKALGRFNHEAAAVDPKTGIVYMTEDRDDSLFYRFIPKTYGKLEDGGRLQALAYVGTDERDSRNWDFIAWNVGDTRDVRWIDLEDADSPEDDLRIRGHAAGAVIFARGEGVHWGKNELFFCCTSGGREIFGQIMRYVPSIYEGTDRESEAPGKLQHFLESRSAKHFNFGDNLTVAENGHLIVCEDQYTDEIENHLRGVTPEGLVYDFARVRIDTEPAGACFSPDGSTLFVNLYSPTRTLAITGPWDTVSVKPV